MRVWCISCQHLQAWRGHIVAASRLQLMCYYGALHHSDLNDMFLLHGCPHLCNDVTLHINTWVSRTISQINDDFRRKVYRKSKNLKSPNSRLLYIFPLIVQLIQWKKRSDETQTLRTGCSKAEPKKFRSAPDPLPGGAGRPKFNQREIVQ